ncbi:UNVERIFIED_ORG: hypothetical protein ABID33_000227 [Xanthobacter viscosus]|uniref:Uncharacterized protein n=1 Tax=Xanthobacter autotrophicus TaxID=280 RepID=A0A6C1KJR4_XANAU|nr:hypothetical protein [Xanthobacter autotrophicus]TLX43877.1 hypothetical protein FBQ73_07195 [Xanthobacter autotrophicus]
MTRARPKSTLEAIARMTEMAQAGALAVEIARDIGVSPACIIKWAKRADVRLPSRSEAQQRRCADPAVRAQLAEASRVGRPPRSDLVPRWVPADLKGEYIDFAVLYGEECAASRIRQMKAEALAC